MPRPKPCGNARKRKRQHESQSNEQASNSKAVRPQKPRPQPQNNASNIKPEGATPQKPRPQRQPTESINELELIRPLKLRPSSPATTPETQNTSTKIPIPTTLGQSPRSHKCARWPGRSLGQKEMGGTKTECRTSEGAHRIRQQTTIAAERNGSLNTQQPQPHKLGRTFGQTTTPPNFNTKTGQLMQQPDRRRSEIGK